jgi:hypothetical protein
MNLATVAPKSTRKSNRMMQDMMGVGGMWGMGLPHAREVIMQERPCQSVRSKVRFRRLRTCCPLARGQQCADQRHRLPIITPNARGRARLALSVRTDWSVFPACCDAIVR